MEVSGKEIRIRGRLIRTAFLDGEGYQFLEDPEAAMDLSATPERGLTSSRLFRHFRIPSPKYRYPMEWDNMAVLPSRPSTTG